MAIRKVGKARKRRATRSANPRKRTRRVVRRKRSNPKRKAVKRRRRRANPKARTIVKYRTRKAPVKRRRRRRKNAGNGKAIFKLAGIDMGAVALGTAAAVLIKNGLNNIGFIGDQIKKLPDSVQPLMAPALVIGSGWAIHKYAKNPMLKKIGAYAAVAGVVLAVDDFANKQFKGLFGGAWHNYGGAYHQFSGAYVQMPKSLGSGMGGGHIGSSMFGGITNLA